MLKESMASLFLAGLILCAEPPSSIWGDDSNTEGLIPIGSHFDALDRDRRAAEALGTRDFSFAERLLETELEWYGKAYGESDPDFRQTYRNLQAFRSLRGLSPEEAAEFADAWRTYWHARETLEQQRAQSYPRIDVMLGLQNAFSTSQSRVESLLGPESFFVYRIRSTSIHVRCAAADVTGDESSLLQQSFQFAGGDCVDACTAREVLAGVLNYTEGPSPKQQKLLQDSLTFLRRFDVSERCTAREELTKMLLSDSIYHSGQATEADKLVEEVEGQLPADRSHPRVRWVLALVYRYHGRKALDAGDYQEAGRQLAHAHEIMLEPAQHCGLSKGLAVAEIKQWRAKVYRAEGFDAIADAEEAEARKILDHLAKLRAALQQAREEEDLADRRELEAVR